MNELINAFNNGFILDNWLFYAFLIWLTWKAWWE